MAILPISIKIQESKFAKKQNKVANKGLYNNDSDEKTPKSTSDSIDLLALRKKQTQYVCTSIEQDFANFLQKYINMELLESIRY